MSLFPPSLLALAEDVIRHARQKRLRIAAAESCTGGLLSACLTEVSGASDAFDRGFIVYSNDAKMAQLAVERKTLADFGAVSAQTALEMAEGALRASHADIAVAVTGIAGPGGGTAEKPVGLVYLALANGKNTDAPHVVENHFDGDRAAVRLSSVDAALRALLQDIACA